MSNEFYTWAEKDYSQAYKNQYSAYFRWDINLNIKLNFKKVAIDFFVELANITNHKNVWTSYYSIKKQEEKPVLEEVYVYHYGFTPIAGVKIYF